MLNKSFITVTSETDFLQEKTGFPSFKGFLTSVRNLITLPTRLPKIAREQVMRYGSEPFLFSLFMVLFSMVMLISPHIVASPV